MSAAKELFRIVGAWEDETNYFSIGLEFERRHLKMRSGPAGSVRVARGRIEKGEAMDYVVDEEERTAMSPEDVRAELRWLSLGEKS